MKPALASLIALAAFWPGQSVAGPKNPSTFSPRACQISDRPEFAWDAKSGKPVPVGPDRYFVLCHEEVVVKGKVKQFGFVYLKGDLGGYGYYADYNEAFKAAHEWANLRKEQSNAAE